MLNHSRTQLSVETEFMIACDQPPDFCFRKTEREKEWRESEEENKRERKKIWMYTDAHSLLYYEF